MTQGSLWTESGAVTEKRPRPCNVRAIRGLRGFESKEAALAWSNRHAPLRTAEVTALSAHPRAVRMDNGEYCLVYAGCAHRTTAQFILRTDGRLMRKR